METVRVRANVEAKQDVVNVSTVLLVDSVDGSRSCFEAVPLIQSCDLFRCWYVIVILWSTFRKGNILVVGELELGWRLH